jgi:hypothetical protein
LLRDVELVKHIHPDLKIIAYYDQTIPSDILAELENLEVILVDMSKSGMHPPLWKFLAANLPDAGHVSFRDLHPGYTLQEKEWLDRLKSKDTWAMSFIWSLMIPIVELRKFMGG